MRLGPAFAAIGVGLSAAAFTRFVSAGIDVADQLNTISKRTGVAVEDLSVLKFAAEQSGTNFEALTTGLQKFEIKLAKAGISGNQTIAMLLGLADHFKATEDPATRLSEAIAIFGKSAGPELVPFLAQGSAGINELIQKLRDMGGVITGETAAAADEFNDQLAALGTQAHCFCGESCRPGPRFDQWLFRSTEQRQRQLTSIQSEIGNLGTLLAEEEQKTSGPGRPRGGALEFLERHRIKAVTIPGRTY